MIHHNYPAIQARCDQYKSADLIAFDRILDYGGAQLVRVLKRSRRIRTIDQYRKLPPTVSQVLQHQCILLYQANPLV